MGGLTFETIEVRHRGPVCFVRMNRPEAENAINAALVNELTDVIATCRDTCSVIVLEGQPEAFCIGADFAELEEMAADGRDADAQTRALYDLWLALATGPFVSVAHVRGRVAAGGIGFVAACDVTVADMRANFSLPEMLFGLMPACVLPFLIRRTGPQKAHVMTLMGQTLTAQEAQEYGLIDVVGDNSDDVVRKQLLRLQRLEKTAVTRYKDYRNTLGPDLIAAREGALAANRAVFSDPRNIRRITHFRQTGQILRDEAMT